jgi:DNA primase small subunit
MRAKFGFSYLIIFDHLKLTLSVMTATEIIDNEKRALIEAKDKESKSKSSNLFTPELLSTYYSRLFPYELLFDWLNYDPGRNDQDKLFSNREFSFTIDIGGEEVYIRYQSYSKLPDFQDAILQRKPIKIDIGAVYSHPPKDHKTVSQGFTTVQRELVFDIDLTDYDSIRNCGCTGATICKKCWKMMNMAIKVMDVGLREDFGFKHIAWFYSGRRGVHAWICDEKARTLSNEARSAVAAYFEVCN